MDPWCADAHLSTWRGKRKQKWIFKKNRKGEGDFLMLQIMLSRSCLPAFQHLASIYSFLSLGLLDCSLLHKRVPPYSDYQGYFSDTPLNGKQLNVFSQYLVYFYLNCILMLNAYVVSTMALTLSFMPYSGCYRLLLTIASWLCTGSITSFPQYLMNKAF